MAAIRRDITTNARDADRFVQGALALRAEGTGLRSTDLGITAGPLAGERELSSWDLFVIWHVWAMQQISSDGRRNAAHMGPVFLPWHRWYLIVLEFHMQRVLGLGRDDFGLPYWNWSADGERSPAQQRRAPVWGIVGGDGRAGDAEVDDGPFTRAAFEIGVEQGPGRQLRTTARGLRRRLGQDVNRLPREADVAATLADGVYDRPGWDAGATSMRNRLEGWVPFASAPAMHNRVHVWVGGDMGPGSSPNDPVFFLNHCYVDRLWERWRENTADPSYRPTGRSQPNDPLFRHRLQDPIYSILTRAQPSIASMIDPSDVYVYE